MDLDATHNQNNVLMFFCAMVTYLMLMYLTLAVCGGIYILIVAVIEVTTGRSLHTVFHLLLGMVLLVGSIIIGMMFFPPSPSVEFMMQLAMLLGGICTALRLYSGDRWFGQ